jgi:hypothetical protein
MKPRAYKTPEAFKAAIDQRLRQVAGPGIAITRRRQLLVFDRYLARIARTLGDAAVLKGGLVLEVRLERARTTRFAGIPAPELLLYPVETHVAEKLHAYTLPRPTPSTRVKDLPEAIGAVEIT